LNEEIWNGKAKFFFNYKLLKFEGEYLNGKRWNGRIYDAKNENTFELKDGKGYIMEYDHKGNLNFEGDYLNGKKWNGKFMIKKIAIFMN